MTTTIIIFLITYFFIATEKIDKTVAALLGASAVIFLHTAPYEDLLSKIDFNVIFLLMGMMITVGILSITGIFEWVAIMLAQKARGNGIIITLFFIVITAFFSAFLDNVTTIILVVPITILITQILNIPTAPLLVLEAIFSNIGGTATLIGDPPNILIASQTNLSFKDFIVNLAPVVVVIITIALALVFLLMQKIFHVNPILKKRIMKAEAKLAIVEPQMLVKALIVFGFILVGFFISHVIHIDASIISLAGALVMVLVTQMDFHQVLKFVEWNAILFFIGLFMLIGSMETNGVFDILGHHMLTATNGNLMLTAFAVLWSSAIISSIVDNIPLVIAMIPLLKTVIPVFAAQMGIEGNEILVQQQVSNPLFWSLALGACLGGNGTLVGASANVVVSQIAKRNNLKISFGYFSKYGIPFMLLSLVISTVYIWLRFF
ncbi:MAG: ArsB/NhaD family transporter [Candidatus Marinimicrobia bacterium]|nr:ArsB/NhaD family transporter [Candidatus Neomarinimicrobiota bacterium]